MRRLQAPITEASDSRDGGGGRLSPTIAEGATYIGSSSLDHSLRCRLLSVWCSGLRLATPSLAAFFAGMSRDEIDIREAVLSDVPLLAENVCRLAAETESYTLDPAITGRSIEEVFRKPALGTFYSATKNGNMVGQLMIRKEWIPSKSAFSWWIHSVYVKEEYRNRGYYRALYSHVRRIAQEQGVQSLRLYVLRENVRASATYAKLGMKKCGAVYELSEHRSA